MTQPQPAVPAGIQREMFHWPDAEMKPKTAAGRSIQLRQCRRCYQGIILIGSDWCNVFTGNTECFAGKD